MKCVYFNNNGVHGKCDACKGCVNDPNHSELTREEFLDMNCRITCGQCKHFQVDAERREDTTCKRIDHKHFQFAVPWFKSYDCGQYGGCICKDFEPTEMSGWLFRHWKGYDFIYPTESTKIMGLCIDKDQSVRYMIRVQDFVDNTFLDSEGNLKWIEKMYYKRCSKETNPIGYILVHERRQE